MIERILLRYLFVLVVFNENVLNDTVHLTVHCTFLNYKASPINTIQADNTRLL